MLEQTTDELKHYRTRAVRALVLMHEQSMKDFLSTWQSAKAAGIRLPEDGGEHYRSLNHLLQHIFRSSGKYMRGICERLGLPDPQIPAVPEVERLDTEAQEYLARLLAQWRVPLVAVEEQDLEPESYVPGMHYWVDAMLEHAAFHPLRHQFQLRELMQQQHKEVKK